MKIRHAASSGLSALLLGNLILGSWAADGEREVGGGNSLFRFAKLSQIFGPSSSNDSKEKVGGNNSLLKSLSTVPSDDESLEGFYLRAKVRIDNIVAGVPMKDRSLEENRRVLEELVEVMHASYYGNFDDIRTLVSQVEGFEWLSSLDDTLIEKAIEAMYDVIGHFKLAEKAEGERRVDKLVKTHQNATRQRRIQKENKTQPDAKQKKDYHGLHRSHVAKSERFLKNNASRAHHQLEMQRSLAHGRLPLEATGPSRQAQFSKRKLWDLHRRLEASSKEEQCQLLVDCVNGMSLYDFFIYIHSDDIDDVRGTVDDNLVVFDESNFEAKFAKIQSTAAELAIFDDAKCNSLLQQFHRTVEVGSVAEWQPGTISQVCLAEGTTTYVQLAEITKVFTVALKENEGTLKIYTGIWGGWKNWKTTIKVRHFACGANLRFESDQGGGDDTAANGLKLRFCDLDDWNTQTDETIWTGNWGEWKGWKNCPQNQFIVGAKVRYENSQGGGGDDTALNGLKIYCAPSNTNTGGSWVSVYDGLWGDWKAEQKRTDETMLVSGARVQYEDDQGGGDDTAMNGLEFQFETTGDEFWEKQKLIAERIVPIPFRCAEELFYSDDRMVNHGDEPFVFEGCTSRTDGATSAGTAGSGTGWELIAGGLKHASPGDADTVWGVNTSDNIYRWLGGSSWEQIDGKLKQISVAADGSVWGVNVENDIYRQNESNGWEKIEGKLKHVSVGNADMVWGVNSSDKIYRWLGGSSWEQIDGKLKQISVAADGSVWGVNVENDIYRQNESNGWEKIEGKLKHVSVGNADTVWGVNSSDNIYRWLGGSSWEQIDGKLKQIDVTADGTVWGVNSADNIFRRTFQVRKLSRSLEVAVADCPLDNYQYPVLDVSADSGLRDQHGQLTSMQGAFSFRTAAGLTKDYESCQEAERAKYDKPDSDMTLEELTEEYNNCLRDNFYEPIDQSLQLVFGSNPSPGFICGVKDAVKAYTKNDGKALPGYCCLDAPYELGNEHWGYKYDCSINVCKTYGPYFAGVSENACLAQGGTFCDNPTDCSDLKTCISEMAADAISSGKPAFAAYLEDSPNITDTTDPIQCGSARSYFGFQSNYINDAGICLDIAQFKSTPNFDFLEEFFNQGSDAAADEDAEMPDFYLTPIDRSEGSEADPVVNGPTWYNANFGLAQSFDSIEAVVDTITDLECPADITGAVQTACAAAKNVLGAVFSLLQWVVEFAVAVSEHMFSIKAELNNIQPMESWEDTQAIYEHMMETGKYMQEGFDKILAKLETSSRRDRLLLEGNKNNVELDFESHSLVVRALDTCNEGKKELEAKLEKLNDGNDELEAKLETLRNERDKYLDLMVEIVDKDAPTTLLILSTLRGVPQDVEVEVMAYGIASPEGKFPVEFDVRPLGKGETLITLKEEVAGGLVFVKVRGAEIETTRLVSLK